MQKRNCPECNQPLTWIPQYQRWYCKKEKIYPELPLCPICKQPLNWIPQYKRWYCYNDNTYPSLSQAVSKETISKETHAQNTNSEETRNLTVIQDFNNKKANSHARATKEDDEVTKAIIKALRDKIVKEVLAEKDLNAHPIQNIDDGGSVGLDPSSKVVRHLINELAKKRLAYGLAKGEDPEKW